MENEIKIRNKNTGEVITLRRKGTQSAPKPFSEGWYQNNFKKTEQNIAGRTDMMNQGIGDIVEHPFKTAAFPIPTMTKMAVGSAQRLGSAVFNPLIKYQTSDVGAQNPLKTTGDMFGESVKGLTGERLGQMSDLMTNVGASEKIAIPAGAIGEFAVMGGAEGLESIYQLGKGAVNLVGQGAKQLPKIMKQVTSTLRGVEAKGIQKTLEATQKSMGFDIGPLGKKLPVSELPGSIGYQIGKLKTDASLLSDAIDKEMALHAKNVLEPHIKTNLPKMFRKFGDTYATRLDEIASNLETPITRQEVEGILDSVLSKHSEQFLPEGIPFSKVNSLKLKYASSEELNKLPTDEISLQQFKQDVSNVYRSMSGRAKGGIGYNPEDVAAQALYHEWGEFIATKSPEFAKLQAEARPVLQAMKASQKLFKPYGNIFDKTQGAKYLTDYALAKAQGQLAESQIQLVDFIEKGNKFTPGLGNVTDQLTQFAKGKVQLGKDLAELVASYANKKTNVEQLIAIQSDLIKKQKDMKNMLLIGGGILAGTGAIKGLTKIFSNLNSVR